MHSNSSCRLTLSSRQFHNVCSYIVLFISISWFTEIILYIPSLWFSNLRLYNLFSCVPSLWLVPIASCYPRDWLYLIVSYYISQSATPPQSKDLICDLVVGCTNQAFLWSVCIYIANKTSFLKNLCLRFVVFIDHSNCQLRLLMHPYAIKQAGKPLTYSDSFLKIEANLYFYQVSCHTSP